MLHRYGRVLGLVVLAFTTGCASGAPSRHDRTPQSETGSYMNLNLAAGTTVLYELQVRSANACDPTVGSPAQQAQCNAKLAPNVVYRAQGMSCGNIGDLQRIKLGTLDDLLADTADYRAGITLRYIHDRLGANMVWIMPPFPNNDTWNLPDACDNLGSPYAVRDYMHISGMASNACITAGSDEHNDAAPCWGNDAMDKVIQTAHQHGMKIMLDIAFNHFGHNYLMYDYAQYTPVSDRIAQGQDVNNLWNFDATFEGNLLHPVIIDSIPALQNLASRDSYTQNVMNALHAKCPSLAGEPLVRAFHQWQNALPWERNMFQCSGAPLEFQDPGFYLGADSYNPSQHIGDDFTNNWTDVKFLFHHEENVAHQWEFVRNREYLFRVVNYWVSRGVDGFRFDHTTDPNGGMGPNEWKYILSKVDYYAHKRGQGQPIYLAEEFNDQMGMSKVVDVMTDGYVGNMKGPNGVTKDAGYVEGVIRNNDRFQGHTYVMTALETHDEPRLLQNTGFDIWTGAGFWGIGATTWSTPMLLMGQEFGESWGLGFRRSDFLRARFVGTGNYNAQGDSLVGLYGAMINGRLNPANRALYSSNYSFLPLQSNPTGGPDARIYAVAKWTQDGNVVFAFHNLWPVQANQAYFIPPDLAGQMSINDGAQYRLIDIITNQQQGGCTSGANLKMNFPVFMSPAVRAQWLRLELCQ